MPSECQLGAMWCHLGAILGAISREPGEGNRGGHQRREPEEGIRGPEEEAEEGNKRREPEERIRGRNRTIGRNLKREPE